MNPVIPPRPDVSYVGATGKASSSSKSTGMVAPSSTPPDHGGHAKAAGHREPPPLPPHPDSDMEAREEMRQRELEEARARAAQMEKTMRWWSDCTANWREKWGKVRNERNKARDECRHLRSKLEHCSKELTLLKRERQEMHGQMDTLRKQMEGYQEKERSSVCSSGSHKSAPGSDHERDSVKEKDISLSNVAGSDDFVNKLLSKKDRDFDSSSSRDSEKSAEKRHSRKSGDNSPSMAGGEDSSLAQQNIKALQLKLEEAQKVLSMEREEKSTLIKSLEDQQGDMMTLRVKYEELEEQSKVARTQLEKREDDHRDELVRIVSQLEDESSCRSDKDKRLADLRKELERLQAENAQQWGKCERLDTEKLSLERENKKLRAEIEHLQEEVERKTRQAAAMLDSDVRTLQFDLTERNKELLELKHTQHRMKKVLAEKTAELEHARARAEQYEVEVKKLRTRVDELKRDLASAEDEVDQQGNQIRRLQRTNDELQEQTENLQVQVEHLQTRLRRSNSQPMLGPRAASLKSFDLTANDSTDAASDDDEGAGTD